MHLQECRISKFSGETCPRTPLAGKALRAFQFQNLSYPPVQIIIETPAVIRFFPIECAKRGSFKIRHLVFMSTSFVFVKARFLTCSIIFLSSFTFSYYANFVLRAVAFTLPFLLLCKTMPHKAKVWQ